ncbi:MAG: STAS/SEC14 domain-containing protein [Mycobacterium sp.]|nr:STAS/SEC14 domain-containing protein [Mycobacterium sp.]
MIQYHLDKERSILHVQPDAPLKREDFVELAKVVDPYIEATGDLGGLLVEAPTFPGWDSFGAMVTHLRFVRDHQQHVRRIAVATDSPVGDLAEHLVSHFVSAEVRHFPAAQTDAAQQWVSSHKAT